MSELVLKDLFGRYRQRYIYDPTYERAVPLVGATKLWLVVPVYDEDLTGLTNSLAECSGPTKEATLLLVFNNPENSPLRQKHKEQAAYWHGQQLANGIKVYALAALGLPEKHAGVGLARKIGMDAALAAFAGSNYDGLIVCLDADCGVSVNYLTELLRAEQAGIRGASLYFEHQLEDLAGAEQQRIINYEVWLRYYVQCLRRIGYWHAFHTVGSSMAVRASTYARIGGMNRRKAGEDFYFLHKLIPHGRFYDLTTTTVYPSARESARVPFGTGRAMMEMEAGTKDFSRVYAPEIFHQIKPLISDPDYALYNPGEALPRPLQHALSDLGWVGEMQSLIRRSANPESLKTNFKYWLDGFRMLKLVHWLRDNCYGEIDSLEACNNVLNINTKNHVDLIKALRELDRNSPFDYF